MFHQNSEAEHKAYRCKTLNQNISLISEVCSCRRPAEHDCKIFDLSAETMETRLLFLTLITVWSSAASWQINHLSAASAQITNQFSC